jgi:hypothetical protein
VPGLVLEQAACHAIARLRHLSLQFVTLINTAREQAKLLGKTKGVNP